MPISNSCLYCRGWDVVQHPVWKKEYAVQFSDFSSLLPHLLILHTHPRQKIFSHNIQDAHSDGTLIYMNYESYCTLTICGFHSSLLFDCFFKAITYMNLQIPNLTSAIILPRWCQFAAMETVTSWGCPADEKFQEMKKHWGSDTLLRNTDPVWFSMLVLNWTEIVHCRRNITFWLEEEYLGLCFLHIFQLSHRAG